MLQKLKNRQGELSNMVVTELVNQPAQEHRRGTDNHEDRGTNQGVVSENGKNSTLRRATAFT